MRRPAGVTAIATLFLLNAACLCSVGVIMLTAPQGLSSIRSLLWLRREEMAGPYVVLLMGTIWGVIG